MPNHRASYRPEIDGLRALAVLSVVLYHLGIEALSGGFVGVDMFFVISGYLITKLLSRELEEKGTIDYKSFYLRRIKRIIPALFFVLLISTIAAVFILTPERLMSYGASLVSSVLSVSNIYFFTVSGYFDSRSAINPLLHTWSLGVEEQFYLLWPLVLAFFWARHSQFKVVFLAIGIVSFCFAMWLIDTNPSAVFYLMPFRIGEFAIGAALITLEGTRLETPKCSSLLFLCGLGLIGYSVFGLDKHAYFPGANALWPCLGVALCIYSARATKLSGFLRTRVFVSIGLISYSLYLIHWPLIVFFKIVSGHGVLGQFDAVGLFVAAISASIAMYYFVERPFRNILWGSNVLFAVVTIGIVLVFLGVSMAMNGGWSWRNELSNVYTVENIQEGKDRRFNTRRKICANKGWDNCDKPIKEKINALIIGDSHSIDALNALYAVFPEHDFSMSTLGGCPPHEKLDSIFPANYPNLLECLGLNEKRLDPHYLNTFDYLVIHVLFSQYDVEHLAEYLKYLKKLGIKKVVIMGGYYTLNEEMHEIVNRYGRAGFDENLHVTRRPSRDSELEQIVEGMGYFFLSTKDAFCSANKCRFFDRLGVPFSYDMHHLSFEFASEVAILHKNQLSEYLID